MAEKIALSKEAFLIAAKAAGLEADEAHLEELYAFVRNVLPSLGAIDELDLRGWEPIMPPCSGKEGPA